MIYGYIRKSGREGWSQGQTEKYILRAAEKLCPDEFGGMFTDEQMYLRINLFDRPAGEDLFRRLKEGDYILVPTLESAFVSIENFSDTVTELIERNIFLNVLELGVDFSTELGSVVYDTIETLASFNRRCRSSITREAMQVIRDGRGPVNKESPMGYMVVRADNRSHFVPDQKERKLIAEMIQWRDEGTTWSEILRRIGNKKRANGNKWNQANIRVAYQAGLDGFPGFDGQKDAFDILEKDRKRGARARKTRGKNELSE